MTRRRQMINNIDKCRSSLIDLLSRIETQHNFDEENKSFGKLKKQFVHLIIFYLILYFYGCPTRIFNCYSSRVTFLVDCLLLIWFSLQILVYVIQFVCDLVHQPKLFIHPIVKDQMKELKINSLQILNDLIEDTSEENIYDNRLLLSGNEYLIMFHIDLNEHNPYVLRQFYMEPSLTIIPFVRIIGVTSNGITISYFMDFRLIPFPKIVSNHVFKWIHERLMIISKDYRSWPEGSKLIREENALYFEPLRNKQRLIGCINEEKELQLMNYGIDLYRKWKGLASAEAEFIAKFRLIPPDIVQILDIQLMDTFCSVCLDKFQSGECYSRWPCEDEHIFHYACMLDVLRRQNTCPICLNAVDPAPLPTTKSLIQQILSFI